jgi:hypothetical protein
VYPATLAMKIIDKSSTRSLSVFSEAGHFSKTRETGEAVQKNILDNF